MLSSRDVTESSPLSESCVQVKVKNNLKPIMSNEQSQSMFKQVVPLFWLMVMQLNEVCGGKMQRNHKP